MAPNDADEVPEASTEEEEEEEEEAAMTTARMATGEAEAEAEAEVRVTNNSPDPSSWENGHAEADPSYAAGMSGEAATSNVAPRQDCPRHDDDADDDDDVARGDGGHSIDLSSFFHYSHYPASAPASSWPQQHHLTALAAAQMDLQVRYDVSSVLGDMLSDVETAHSLATQLSHSNSIDSLRRMLNDAQTALDEERALREEGEVRRVEECRKRAELGDRFVSELIRLSADLAELERWKEDHVDAARERAELREELARSEEASKRTGDDADVGVAEDKDADDVDAEDAGSDEQAAAEAAATSTATATATATAATRTTITPTSASEAGVAADTALPSGVDAITSASATSESKTQDELLAEEEERELQAALAASLAEAEKEREAREAAKRSAEGHTLDTSTSGEGRDGKKDDGRSAAAASAAFSPGTMTTSDEAKAEETLDAASADSSRVEKKEGVDKDEQARAERRREGAPTATTTMDNDEIPPALESLPEYALMRIFGYLEAFDILSTAQVNVSLYSRVDTLFGLGEGSSGGGGGEGASKSHVGGGTPAAVPAVESRPDPKKEESKTKVVPVRGGGGGGGSASSKVTAKKTPASAPAPAPALAPAPAPTRVAIPRPARPSPPPPPTPPPAAAAPAPSAPRPPAPPSHAPPPRLGAGVVAGGVGGLTTMFSQLRSKAQPKVTDGGDSAGGSTAAATTAASSSAAAATPVSSSVAAAAGLTTAAAATAAAASVAGAGGTVTGVDGGTIPLSASAAGGVDSAPGLNAAMASSMASKLTAAELSVIISMQTRLRQKDLELGRLRAERDDADARMRGVESVKDFLVSKVRDAEKSNREKREELAKVVRQSASDQEVIAFLDGRVQELERALGKAEDARAKVEGELGRMRGQGSQKVRVLSDMLQFEREQLAESEREWKAQKKVLVKEVKSCRAQIVSLEAERDGLYEQNGKLKEALLKFNGGGNGLHGRMAKR